MSATEEPRPPVRQYPYDPDANVVRRRTTGEVVGIVLAVVLGLLGLVVLGVLIMFVVALNSWGSNK